jgi:hypothetical protein
LWTAVIVMAVEDWRNGSLRARREAQSFLFEDNADFQAVCASAGLDPATLSGSASQDRAARSHARAVFSKDGGIDFIWA